ncbi:MAG TPA: metallophosphoesterase [Chloroflexota bacterium]|nr:metallophosphoesterase [Chloroflexota bacterium]
MPTIAAVADVHCHEHMRGQLAEVLRDVDQRAGALVLAGDVTASGQLSEARELLRELRHVTVPIVAVLGNHDFEHEQEDEIHDLLKASGIHILDGDAVELDVQGERVGFAGTKGFAGGFGRYLLTGFGEQSIKDFVLAGMVEVEKLERALSQLHTERRVVVLHYSPVRETLVGEPMELYPFLGNSELSKPIDNFGAEVVFHGHSHYGTRFGRTKAGVPVFNVAQTLVMGYHLYQMVDINATPETDNE